jgi:predicted RNase H-like HicB family nuclease
MRQILPTIMLPSVSNNLTTDTIEEARMMAAVAVRLYLTGLKKEGLPFPLEHHLPLAEQVEIAFDVE